MCVRSARLIKPNKHHKSVIEGSFCKKFNLMGNESFKYMEKDIANVFSKLNVSADVSTQVALLSKYKNESYERCNNGALEYIEIILKT
jgi:hypothetical protein